jgi:Lon protease-like protein
MTQAGNHEYKDASAVPAVVPVFPLSAGLLLPRGQTPLNIFEPRYVAMIDTALRTDRIVGMIQPRFDSASIDRSGRPDLCDVGCLGRITQLAESGDGRYLITLTGIARFRVIEELATVTPYRQCRIDCQPFADDFKPNFGEAAVDRKALLKAFRAYLDDNNMEADWSSVDQASNETLVNALSMMSPYGAPEKQALLEAASLRMRADTLIAITEMMLAKGNSDTPGTLQ